MNGSPMSTTCNGAGRTSRCPDSVGMDLGDRRQLMFLYVGYKAIAFEREHFAEITSDPEAQALAARVTNGSA